MFEPAGEAAQVSKERAAASVMTIGKGWETPKQDDVDGFFGQKIVKQP